jgi:hypothetical protein
MRIQELTGYKSHPAYTSSEGQYDVVKYVENLKSLGFKITRLGGGAFAEVFSRPNDSYVIKIFRDDPGYEQYLKYINQFKDNPHVPKLRGKVMNLQNNIRVIRMEKLRKLDRDNNEEMEIYELIKNIVTDNGRYPVAYKKEVETISQRYPQIMPLLKILQTHRKDIDLGKDNIMFRGSTPVITDPLSYFD